MTKLWLYIRGNAREMFCGPFCRLENSRSQTRADTQKQVASNEIWGAASRNIYASNFPCVKAYKRGLLPGEMGIEFVTSVAPTKGSGGPTEARCYEGDPGVISRRDTNGIDYAVIPITVIKTQP